MKIFTSILLLGFLCPILLFGQGETNNWYFGNGAGIQFDPDGSVTATTDGQLKTFEGCATISDPSGALLFYTDGITVYDRNHGIMENGEGLFGDPSSTQSALIVPKPQDPDVYYIFTVDTSVFEGDPDHGLNYSVVDMSLNEGAGAVLRKNVTLLRECSEKIAAVIKTCSDPSIWILTLAANDRGTDFFNTYNAFEINPLGVVHSPIKTSFADLKIEDARGYLKFSSDGKKIASANGRSGLFLYDFDASTGMLANQQMIPIAAPNKRPYGVEFSPNNQYLYVHASNDLIGDVGHTSSLLQYDVLAPNIVASEIVLDSRPIYRGALQLGTNGKIYRTLSVNYFEGTSFLGVIDNPNQKGIAANYRHNAISLEGKVGTQGLPPFIQSFFNKIELLKNADDTTSNSLALCEGEGFQLEGPELTGATYLWEKDGVIIDNAIKYLLEIGSVVPRDAGRYRLVITGPDPLDCPIVGEAFISVASLPPTGDLTLVQCDADALDPMDGITTLNLEQLEDSANFSYYYYETQTALQNHLPIPNPIGYSNTRPYEQLLYYRVVNDQGCENFGTLQLQIEPTNPAQNPNSTFYVCDDEEKDGLLRGTFDMAGLAEFQFTGNDIRFYRTLEDVSLEQNPISGQFTTEATIIYGRLENDNHCVDVLPIALAIHPKPNFSMQETFLLCTDNPVLTITAPEGFDTYRFLKKEGTSEYLVSTQSTVSIVEHGNYILEVGYTYTNSNETLECTNQKEFVVLPSNIAVISEITVTDISHNNTIQIAVSGDGVYEFSLDGLSYQESNFFEHVSPGFVSVYVRDKNGCGIREELISVVGYPTFFTPNGDGTNDVWQLMGVNDEFQGTTRIAIYDRFGKEVGRIRPESAGWDGTYNTVLLPASDYWFRADLEDGRKLEGHFALKR